MKNIITLLSGSILAAGLPAASITSSSSFDNSFYDSYNGFHDVTIDSYTSELNATTRPIGRLFDGNKTDMIFESVGAGGKAIVEFSTSTAVEINEFILILQEDGSGNNAGARSASAWVLYGNDTGTNFDSGDTISSGTINPDYVGGYGGNKILVSDSGLSVTAQFFRLELTQAAGTVGNSAESIRVLEVGALTSIPEPSHAGLFFGGILLGVMAIYRRR